ncbi:hypothetical protein CRUP_035499 [Coryphaenoides rupestris]|nr:hypothetical protein CRUP_035499 [Coryphaenoides rupestris]
MAAGTLLIRVLTRVLTTRTTTTRAFISSGSRVVFYLGLPAACYLAVEAHRRILRTAVVHAAEKVDEILEQADYLHSCAETEKLYQLLQPYKDSDDAEFLWRLARATRDRAMVPGLPADQKKVLVFEAFGYAEKALEKDDTCFTSHKWYGILLSDYVKPGFYSKNLLMLGKTYLAMKDLENARLWLTKARDYRPITPEDKEKGSHSSL